MDTIQQALRNLLSVINFIDSSAAFIVLWSQVYIIRAYVSYATNLLPCCLGFH